MEEARGSPPRIVGGRYRLEELIGRGGMGRVYRAVDVSTCREVALKWLAVKRRASRDELRFQREFHTLASLRHPRIVAVYDYGRDGDGAYYTMELLDGRDLKQAIPMAADEACRVLRDLASVLAFLHARGLVHRDLKPRNVRYTESGTLKLMDFGVLATVGARADVSGTPAFAAPEVLDERALDGRTDLYSLGALAYALLTGRPPYIAQRFEDLRTAWQEPLVVPSIYAPRISPALDELVVELLCLDRLGRPASAAAVMDRLTAIGGLPREPEIEIERGYLASAATVGRRREMSQLREGLDRMTAGEGAVAFLTAPSGAGKTRLLHELALEAKLRGALVAFASCERTEGSSYGVMEQLLLAILDGQPAAADDLPPGTAGTLARVLPALSRRLGDPTLVEPAVDPGEERMRVQRAMAEWLRAIARRQKLLLLVDDVQRADEASAAVLAGLSRNRDAGGIYLAVALRRGESVRARHAVQVLGASGIEVTLEGLDDAEVLQLVHSLFGDVSNSGRLASYMQRVSRGNPLLCIELARNLVDGEVVRYVDGEWLIPTELDDKTFAGLGSAIERRLHGLSAAARSLGEVLSVRGGATPLAGAVALSELDTTATFAALGELVAAGILLEERDGFRFQHDQLREALLRGSSDARRRQLHRRLGEHLLATGAAQEGEIGLHLLRGGDRQRGAEMLERHGTRLFSAQALADCIEPLEAAHAVLVERKAPLKRRVAILGMLLAAGWVADRRVGFRYAMETVMAYRHYAGIATAATLGSVVGKHLALLLGIAIASVRWIFAGGPSPMAALTAFSVSLAYACGLTYAANRREEVHALARLTQPLDVFPTRLPHAAHLGIQVFPAYLDGRFGDVERNIAGALRLLENDRRTPFDEASRRFSEVALRGLRVIIDVNQFHPRLMVDLERIESLEFRYYHLVAATARIVHHRFRGEEALAQRQERETETASLQLGTWSLDLQRLLFAHLAYALCHDSSGLKRCIDALESYLAEGFRFEEKLVLARAELLRERGELDAARDLLTSAEPDRHDAAVAQWLGSALASVESEAARHEEALAVAMQVIAMGSDPEIGLLLPRLRCERIAGLALAALKRGDESRRRLESAITLAESRRCVVLAGHLHEARARVALDAGDVATYERHCARAGEWLRPTENPGLVAVHERLLRLGREPHSLTPPAGRAAEEDATTSQSAPSGASPLHED